MSDREPPDGIRYDADTGSWRARHTVMSAGRSQEEAKAALASAIYLTAAHWPNSRVAEIVAEHAALRAERDELVGARNRVRESFHHREEGQCQCVYCLRDAEGLAEHAADYELRWLSERNRAEAAESRLAALEEALTALEQQWRASAAFPRAQPIAYAVSSTYEACADELAALRARLTPETKP